MPPQGPRDTKIAWKLPLISKGLPSWVKFEFQMSKLYTHQVGSPQKVTEAAGIVCHQAQGYLEETCFS